MIESQKYENTAESVSVDALPVVLKYKAQRDGEKLWEGF